jgi:hypothetical protein
MKNIIFCVLLALASFSAFGQNKKGDDSPNHYPKVFASAPSMERTDLNSKIANLENDQFFNAKVRGDYYLVKKISKEFLGEIIPVLIIVHTNRNSERVGLQINYLTDPKNWNTFEYYEAFVGGRYRWIKRSVLKSINQVILVNKNVPDDGFHEVLFTHFGICFN